MSLKWLSVVSNKYLKNLLISNESASALITGLLSVAVIALEDLQPVLKCTRKCYT